MKVLEFDIQRFVETISGTEGHDTLYASAEQQFINALGGNDTVLNAVSSGHENYSFITISGGDGADIIRSGSYNLPANSVSISGGAGNDRISLIGSNATIGGDEGDDYIFALKDNNSINGGSGADNIEAEGSNVIILAESGNDTVYVRNSDYALIRGGDDKDSLIAGGLNRYEDDGGNGITLDGGNGDDYIRSKNNTNGSMVGGDGNDTIVALGSPQNLTIEGGAGNDSISLESGVTAVIYFDSLDGNDIVHGFNGDDTLQFVGSSYSTLASDSDVVVSSAHGNVTLVGAASYSLNIQGVESNDTTPSSTIDPATDTATDTATPSTDTSTSYYVYKGSDVTISASNPSVTSSYDMYDQVNLETDFKSFDIADSDVHVYSSSGTLTIKDVRGKYLKYAGADGKVVAYSYIEPNGTVGSSSNNYYNILGRSDEPLYGILIGGDNVDDLIYAGSGGSSLWGGNHSNDTLIGGAGYDEFIYKSGSGVDVIQNADEMDFVRIEGITASQIIAINTAANEVSANFKDGGSLKIQGTSTVRIAVDGWTVAFDHSSGEWIVK